MKQCTNPLTGQVINVSGRLIGAAKAIKSTMKKGYRAGASKSTRSKRSQVLSRRNAVKWGTAGGDISKKTAKRAYKAGTTVGRGVKGVKTHKKAIAGVAAGGTVVGGTGYALSRKKRRQ